MIERENLVNYRSFHWLWINLFSLIILASFYHLDHPIEGRNGGTPLGYAYGVLATLGILVLMWLGIRKRTYTYYTRPLIGWVSAHLWIGLSLLLVVPLHSGFQLGWNVHSLAYGFLLATVLSGIWGTLNYFHYPREIMSHRGGETVRDLLTKIEMVSTDLEETKTGKSKAYFKMMKASDQPLKASLRHMVFSKPLPNIYTDERLLETFTLPRWEVEAVIQAVNLMKEKRGLINKLMKEIKSHFHLKIWLYFHVPLSFALVATVIIHIFSVFYFQ